MLPIITFNPSIKLALSDVDETIADVYTKATPEMIHELNRFVEGGRALFLISGAGLQSIRERVVDLLKPEIRHQVLVAHCMGAEIWGFDSGGEIRSEPYYSLYEGHFSEVQKRRWREITNSLIEKYHLKTYPTQPRKDFIRNSKGDNLSIMLADRGPQITFEFTNSINLTPEQKQKVERELDVSIPLNHGSYDLRYLVLADAMKLYEESKLPIRAQLGGVFALDHVIVGVDKTRVVKHVLEDAKVMASVGLTKDDLDHAHEIEIWGDKFGQKKGGTDYHMCLAVSPTVRAIDFRDEDITEIPEGYNIQLWDGKKRLHEGLLEYLQSV